MPSLKLLLALTSILAVSTTAAESPSQDSPTSSVPNASAPGKVEATMRYEAGKSRQLTGRILSWTGFGISILGGASGQGGISSAGGLLMTIGIPINGFGAEAMVDAANVLKPDQGLLMDGWGTYKASWFFTGAGTVAAIAAVAGSQSSGDVNQGLAVVAVASLITGQIMQYVAWSDFSESADRAQALKDLASSVEIAPAVYASRNSLALPGVQVALRF